jgi:hypothetical protein
VGARGRAAYRFRAWPCRAARSPSTDRTAQGNHRSRWPAAAPPSPAASRACAPGDDDGAAAPSPPSHTAPDPPTFAWAPVPAPASRRHPRDGSPPPATARAEGSRRLARTLAPPLKIREPRLGGDLQQPLDHPRLLPAWDRSQRLPQPLIPLRARPGDQTRQRRHSGQQHIPLPQPPDSVNKDRSRTIACHPRARRHPLLELCSGRRELPQPARELDLLHVLKPCPAALQIPTHARRILNFQLPGEILQHHLRDSSRIGQEHAQPPGRRQLQREPKPVVLAAAPSDQLPVSTIEEERPVQLVPRRAAVISTVRGRLHIRQELDRHHSTISTRSRNRAFTQEGPPTGATASLQAEGPSRCGLAALFVPLFPTGRNVADNGQ